MAQEKRDYYEVLGVSKTATDAEIKKAYRKLAMKDVYKRQAQGAAKALAAISGCTAAVSTPCAEDLCIAHYEVVQVGRSAAAVLAVTTCLLYTSKPVNDTYGHDVGDQLLKAVARRLRSCVRSTLSLIHI